MSTTTLDRGAIREKLDDFATHWSTRITQWENDGATGTESSYAQSFWSDLLSCFGINAARIDLFEREAIRATTGNKGSMDVFQSGVFIGEAKSLGANLDKAEQQALDYLAGGSVGQHEFPKFIVVTDFARLRIDQLGDRSGQIEFTIDQIAENLDSLLFLAGYETVTRTESEDASIHAAQLMAQLYEAMIGEDADQAVGDDAALADSQDDENEAAQRTSMLLTRILFLLYGDDAGLWEADLFHRWVEQRTDAGNLGAQLSSLFSILNTPVVKRSKNVGDLLSRFPYVNGALFTDSLPLEYFTDEMRDALLEACRFRWTRISPAVFGAMFQLVKSKEARRTAGEHYTSEDNILKTIGPLFLDEYRDRADRLIANKSTRPAQLAALQDELASNIYVDPACGSGNFLNLAYAKLREIETDLIVERRRRIGETGMSLDATLEQKLRIDRFHGFEINWWPAKIAETAMFLVDHQANRQLAASIGQAPERLPITITANIVHGDALDLDWSEELPKPAGQTAVFGNPPFLGHDTRTKEQAEALRRVWKTKSLGRLDYVTAWHAKTIELLAARPGAFAFVTTNSITQGDQVPRLFGPIFKAGWRIGFAHRTFAWDSQAPGKAAVHCVIVGFTREASVTPRLFGYSSPQGEPEPLPVTTGINAYLVDAPNVLVTAHQGTMNPLLPSVTFGSTPRDGGHLIVTADERDAILADPVAAKYLRPFKGARELLHDEHRWCLWLVDLEPSDIARSPVLRARLDAVRAFREESKSPDANAAAATPHLFWWRSQPITTYLCIPSVVSETRRYVTAAQLPPEVVASNLVFTAPDPDGFAFAVISSSMFMAWQKAVGGRLKSDIRFSSTLTWNNFPLPDIDEAAHQKIINAGKGVIAARERHPDRSLADSYNPLAMDPTLVKAHDKLDREVDVALGAPRRLSTERQRLEVLFQRYRELTNAEPADI